MCVPYSTYKFSCSTFKIIFLIFNIVDFSIRFDSHVCTQKSNIIRASYEVFHLLTISCVYSSFLADFCFLLHASHHDFKITFFKFYSIDCSISFDSHVCTQISDIIRSIDEVFHLLTFLCVHFSFLAQDC